MKWFRFLKPQEIHGSGQYGPQLTLLRRRTESRQLNDGSEKLSDLGNAALWYLIALFISGMSVSEAGRGTGFWGLLDFLNNLIVSVSAASWTPRSCVKPHLVHTPIPDIQHSGKLSRQLMYAVFLKRAPALVTQG